MKAVYRILNKIDDLLAKISAVVIFFMMIWIFLDVMLRWLFNSPIKGTVEITGEYFMVILVYFSISYTHRYGGHVGVDVLTAKFSKRMKRWTTLLYSLLALIVVIILGVSNFLEGLDYFEKGTLSSGLIKYPLAPAIMIITFGILILTIRLICDSISLVIDRSYNENTKHEISIMDKEISAIRGGD